MKVKTELLFKFKENSSVKFSSSMPDRTKPTGSSFFFELSNERFIFYKLLEDMLPERQSIITGQQTAPIV
ncbi:hypothetical protein EQO05_08225 [Methanosarcina sp. MSH10X1]|nr:hypothetical protein EQO05_08225 [Methanosarcina sp. MSH10X1]